MAAINLFKKIVVGTFAAVSLAIFSAPAAQAEDYAVAQGYWHTFNNNVDVYSGVFAINKDVSLETSGYFKYTVDFINPNFGGNGEGGGHGGGDDSLTNSNVRAVSGASSAVSSSGSDAKDTRNDITAGITHNFDNIIGIEAYYDYSHEKDYTSNTPTITIKKDLFEKNMTVTLGYSRNMDTINGRFQTNSASRNTNNYFVGITQVLSPFTIAQLGYSRSESKGYGAEGIRLVPLNNTDPSTCTAVSATCVQESHPGTRDRNAYIAGIRHYFKDGWEPLFNRSSLGFTFRYYDDSWDIKSYMTEVEYNKYLSDQWILRLDWRFYDQTKAFFVKDTYTGTEEFKTASPQLLKFNSNLAGIKATYLFPDEGKDAGFRLGSIEGKYEAYAESIKVYAHIFMVGFRMLF